MVGPFGGATAAVLLNAVLKHDKRLGDPVSITVNFAGPIEDGPFTIAAKPTRTNRSTQHWSMTLFQHDGQIATKWFISRLEKTQAMRPIDRPPRPI